MPLPAIAYAGAYIAGQLGGVALGTAIVKKVLPSNRRSSSFAPSADAFHGGFAGDLHQFFNQNK